ncbi:tetratricopeptide repeat protein [Spirosoma jeollabukense]
MKKARFPSKWLFAVGGLLLLCPNHVLAQYPMINGNPAARTLVTAGLDQVYDNQFSAADATFTQLAKVAPNHPSLDLLRGVSLYYQWFPARTDAKLKQRCGQQLELAAKKADDWQKAQKKSKGSDLPEAMFLYFTAEAMLAKISHFEHEPFAAIRHAKNAYPYIQKGKLFQQQYPDFYLSTGLYNFYREVYPEIHPFYKTVAWVMTSGDKKLGMSQLQIATQKALLVRTEAILYLTHLLTDYENKPADALPYLAQLVIKYPGNPYWRYKYAEALLNAHQVETIPHEINHLMATSEEVYHQMGTLVKARYALEKGQRSTAQTLANDVIRSSVRDETVRAYAYLVLARIARIQGQEKQARQYYKQMLEFAEYPILRNEAP